MSKLPLYDEFKVANFRGFDLLEVLGLRRINVVVGRNNTGKTSLLEAMAIPIDFGDPWPASTLRGDGAAKAVRGGMDVPSRDLVLRAGSALGVSLHFWRARDCGVATCLRDLGGTIARNAPYHHPAYKEWVQGLPRGRTVSNIGEFFGDTDARSTGQIVSAFSKDSDSVARYERAMLDTGFERQMESVLRSLDSRVRSLRTLAPDGYDRQVYVDIGLQQRFPLSLLGQGMQRLMSLSTHAYAARGGMLFVDEIEIGLHHSYFEELWRGIRSMADLLDLQVVATTHSYECLAAASVSASAVDDLAVIRLERGSDNRISAQTLSGERLLNAIAHGAELR